MASRAPARTASPFRRDRANPSPRYLALAELYRQMHREGDPRYGISASDTFDGRSLMPCCEEIRDLIRRHGATTILDYGAGKGKQYGEVQISEGATVHRSMKSFWGVGAITCYDPGHAAFATLPEGRFDGVISTDVLEHCPEQDLGWIVDEILSYARKFVYCTVALYPAAKTLPNGENAHCTLRPVSWWQALFEETAAGHPGLHYVVSCEPRSRAGGGAPGPRPIVFEGGPAGG